MRMVEPSEKELATAGEEMLGLIKELYPICRSITGPGLRTTLARIAEVVPLSMTEVPTGTQVFDWTIPLEWSIEEAYVEYEDGRRFIDFRDNSLHVVGYSAPIDAWLPLAELRKHLHTLPQQPDWIPFRTSYYADSWGFCLSHRASRTLPEGRYHAVIRSRLYHGSLTLGEFEHIGRTDDEVLIFTHTCHPALCNDNLSGIAVAATLATFLRTWNTRYTYRFVFAPATIGSIAWMAKNQERLARIRHGLVLAMLGDTGPLHYQRSERGSMTIDRVASHVLRTRLAGSGILDFSAWGFDERQFNSPGIRLPVGRLTRALPGTYLEEHSSADSLDKMSSISLTESLLTCLRIVAALESDERYLNLAPKGEPQLGRRGLYRSTGGYYESVPNRQLALLWILNQSDGRTSLLDIAERANLDLGLLAACADELRAAGLLAPVDSP